jgi:hypothetical protein
MVVLLPGALLILIGLIGYGLALQEQIRRRSFWCPHTAICQLFRYYVVSIICSRFSLRPSTVKVSC